MQTIQIMHEIHLRTIRHQLAELSNPDILRIYKNYDRNNSIEKCVDACRKFIEQVEIFEKEKQEATSKILPCAICGLVPELNEEGGMFCYECPSCATSFTGTTELQARKEWNGLCNIIHNLHR
jgi:hypothetical protein